MDEIIKIRKEIENKKSVVPYNTKIVLQELLDFIDKMCEENQPEYGYISNTYYCGKNHRWNIGDKLAYYECTSNCEGQYELGTITKVEFDKEYDDWLYYFDTSDEEYEESLLSYETYKIR